MVVFRERRKQRLVGQYIDAPYDAPGGSGDRFDGAGAEDVWPVVTRGAHAEHQVFRDVLLVERRHLEAVGDAFLELTHLRQSQVFVQFGLAEQDDLQQLVVGGFQVGQQADFFQMTDY